MKNVFLRMAFLFPGLLLFSSCPQEIDPPPSTFWVRYDRNGGIGELPPAEMHSPGETFQVAGKLDLSKEGHYFSGWDTRPDGSGEFYVPDEAFAMGGEEVVFYARWEKGATKTFWAQSVVSSAWYELAAVKLAEGAHCIVYGDSLKKISQATAEAIVKEYEEKIYPPMYEVFGDPPDIDNNGKVILLLLDILDGYIDSGGYVAGYFSQYHMMSSSGAPNSNEADMLFLDIFPGDPQSDTFYATIAHELQHLIDFGKTSSRDLWINEGLSLSAEYLYGGQRQDRLDLYNHAEAYGLAIPYGNTFFVWNGYWEAQGDSLSNYATAYLFFQWLRLQAKGKGIGGPDGTGIYKAISDAAKDGFGDYRNVTAAAAGINGAFDDWATLFGSWMLANWYNSPEGLFGYWKEISLTQYALKIPEQSYPLYPGEGVFSPFGGESVNYSSPSGNIRYHGLSVPAGPAPEDGNPSSLFQGPPSGQYLLTFNGNPDKNGGTEAGKLGSVSAEARSLQSSQAAGILSLRSPGSAPPLGPYPVGLGDKLAGRGDTLRPVSFEEARTKGGGR
jgi:hypothetical protein